MPSTTFTVDAALVQELGDRLIGRSYIALAELVKNAYDADAIHCKIGFSDDRIVVSDNGHGMSEREFHDYWMRIGTTHKTATRESRGLRRAMTGSKGLGRLSAQFLADEMTLESTSVEEPSRHLYAFVDWTGIRHGDDLNTVNVSWEMRSNKLVDPHHRKTGTRVVLRKLRFEWDANEIERLGQDLWMLQSPFRRSDRWSEAGAAQDFHVDIDAPGIEKAREAFDKLQNALFENWKARIHGMLEDGRSDGRAIVTVDFKAGYPDGLETETSFRETVTLPIDVPRRRGSNPATAAAVDRARFEILIFKPERRQAGGIPVREMRDYLRKFGNVSVHDGGFRLPYYGADHDWLNIAADQNRRLVTSALLPSRLNVDRRDLLDLPSPGRILGTVEIDTNHEWSAAKENHAKPGRWLQIQTGRDRLADNVAFEQLRDLVRFSLDFHANRFRLLSLQTAEKKRAREPPSRTFSRAITLLDRAKTEIPKLAYQEVRREIVAAHKVAAREEQHLDRHAVLLAPLATAGMTALALNHELAREIALLRRASRHVRTVTTSSGTTGLAEVADELDATADRIGGLCRLFDPLLSEEDREAVNRLRVVAVAQQVVHPLQSLMPGVTFDLTAIPKQLRFPVGSFTEWSALLQNLLTNAWNAMLDTNNRLISLAGGRSGRSREWLRVSDTGTGLGVPLEESGMLFEPFERRLRISAENRSIAMGGQGLGLTIVRMIARQRSVQASFVQPEPGFETTMEVSWRGDPREDPDL